MAYSGKYKGSEIDDLLGKAGTALQEHQDISHLATKTEVNAKVDKITGKQLSTEDFTTALKNKLIGLNNYDDTAVNNAINGLQTQINTLVSGDANTAIESFNEIIAFLDGVTDTQTLEGIIAGIEQQIAGKQDTITDLATIRSGAAKGATALQSVPPEYITENELFAKGYATLLETNELLDGKQDTISDLSAIRTNASKGATAVQPSALAAVAVSGSYSDLKDKPSIPTAVTESTVSGWGFTKNTGTYSKPSTGIPKTDLATAVQTSLGKADSALQSIPEKYITASMLADGVAISGPKGDTGATGATGAQGPTGPQGVSVSSIKQTTTSTADAGENVITVTLSNGATSTFKVKNGSKGSQGIQGIQGPTGATGATGPQGVSISSVTQTTTSSADSGENVVTVTLSNGASSTFKFKNGSKGSTGSQGPKGDTGTTGPQGPPGPEHALVSFSATSISLESNKYYKASSALSALSITLATPSNSSVQNEYFVEWTSSASGTTLTVPSSVKWANGNAPSIEANKTYQISIINNLGVWASF